MIVVYETVVLYLHLYLRHNYILSIYIDICIYVCIKLKSFFILDILNVIVDTCLSIEV